MKQSKYNVWVHRGETSTVYNGVTGLTTCIPRSDFESISRYTADSSSGFSMARDTLSMLASARVVVPDDCDEIDLLRTRYALSQNSTDRFSVTIVPSMGCNFDCPYCYENKPDTLLNPEAEAKLLEVVDRKLESAKGLSVNWFGGEPLLGRLSIYKLSQAFIDRCAARGLPYDACIITNGYLLNASTCKNLRAAGVTFAQITIDGPPEFHDRMRPLRSGRGTFERIVTNLRTAVEYFNVHVRINVDSENISYAEDLLAILKERGLAGRIGIGLGQIVKSNPGVETPSTRYAAECLTVHDFAGHELRFAKLAASHGFGSGVSVPRPKSTPCTATRRNDMIIGSGGELYKCWETVGSEPQIVGHLSELGRPDSRAAKWLEYDPFADDECRACIALPVCMGGCAHHAMDPLQHENRCGSFRYNYQELVESYVDQESTAGKTVMIGNIGLRRVDQSC